MVRWSAVATVQWLLLVGLTIPGVARRLRMSARTLAAWVQGWRSDRLAIQEIGRGAIRAETYEREAILAMLGLLGPGVGVGTLMEMFPQVARRELEDLLSRYRDVWKKASRRSVMALRWKGAGRFWAMDYTEAPKPIDGKYPYILVIRDLASGFQILALPCEEATAATTVAALKLVLPQFGAPLVMKHDNGGHFTESEVQELLASWGILALVSPPRTPKYNGAAEAGIGALKTRAHHESARWDRVGEWTCDDVELARMQSNVEGRPGGLELATPDLAWQNRQAVEGEERDRFRQEVQRKVAEARAEAGYLPHLELSGPDKNSVYRVAISRACVALGYLEFRRRLISPRIPRFRKAKLS